MHAQIGEPESMHARMWGGLLQDIVSPMGDMVHYLAKASFLQDMLLGMFVFILQKLAFCKIYYSVCMFVCLFFVVVFFFFFLFFVCNHFCSAFSRSICLTSLKDLLYSCQ